jgi:hypothetical protein
MLKATIMPATLAKDIDEKKNCYLGINKKMGARKNKDAEPEKKTSVRPVDVIKSYISSLQCLLQFLLFAAKFKLKFCFCLHRLSMLSEPTLQ